MAGRGRGWGGGGAHGGGDHLHHTLDVSENIVVPETDHAVAALLQLGGSSRIAHKAGRLVVLSAVEFDHQARGVACEVREVRTDRCLATEVRTINGKMPQVLPQHAFSIRWLMTHCACTWDTAVTFSLALSFAQTPPTPDPSPPLASLVWGGESERDRLL